MRKEVRVVPSDLTHADNREEVLMLEFVAYAICLGAVVVSAFSPLGAWGVLALAVVWVLLIEVIMKYAWDAPRGDENSRLANELASRSGYIRRVPGVVDRFALAALVVKTTALSIALIGVAHAWWWGFPLAIVTYVVMQYAAGNVDPSRVFDQHSLSTAPGAL